MLHGCYCSAQRQGSVLGCIRVSCICSLLQFLTCRAVSVGGMGVFPVRSHWFSSLELITCECVTGFTFQPLCWLTFHSVIWTALSRPTLSVDIQQLTLDLRHQPPQAINRSIKCHLGTAVIVCSNHCGLEAACDLIYFYLTACSQSPQMLKLAHPAWEHSYIQKSGKLSLHNTGNWRHSHKQRLKLFFLSCTVPENTGVISTSISGCALQ